MFSVNFWGSDPAANNDDCWIGWEFSTQGEAEVFFLSPVGDAARRNLPSTAWVELDGPGVYRKRKNPGFVPSRDDWSREYAMQAGMAGGCEAYNGAMGW